MWVSQSSLERIRELELKLADSVPRGVYGDALKRISDLERRVDWQSDMLLRRGQSLPLPPVTSETDDKPTPMPQIDDTVISKAEAIRAEGRRVGAQKDEIEAAIKQQTGWSEADIARAISGNGNQ